MGRSSTPRHTGSRWPESPDPVNRPSHTPATPPLTTHGALLAMTRTDHNTCKQPPTQKRAKLIPDHYEEFAIFDQRTDYMSNITRLIDPHIPSAADDGKPQHPKATSSGCLTLPPREQFREGGRFRACPETSHQPANDRQWSRCDHQRMPTIPTLPTIFVLTV
jgi:hypothetical protein